MNSINRKSSSRESLPEIHWRLETTVELHIQSCGKETIEFNFYTATIDAPAYKLLIDREFLFSAVSSNTSWNCDTVE